MEIFIALLLFVVLVSVFILTYLGNKKTMKPDGVEHIQCKGCRIIECQNNDAHKTERTDEDGN